MASRRISWFPSLARSRDWLSLRPTWPPCHPAPADRCNRATAGTAAWVVTTPAFSQPATSARPLAARAPGSPGRDPGYRSIAVSGLAERSVRGTRSRISFSSIQFGLARYRSVQFSSVQFSSVQFSSVQFSSVQFSSVQFRGRAEQRLTAPIDLTGVVSPGSLSPVAKATGF
jgi:hypothetical protein